MLGLSLSAFTTLHVIVSLIGIAAGIALLPGILKGERPGWLTHLFLGTTALTSITGFMFPFTTLLPSHVVGLLSLAVLVVAVSALYGFRLSGPWRWIYAAGAMAALYFNVFVGVAQSFQKLGPLHALAPTQSEPPFLVAQLVVLGIFLVLGTLAVRRFHPAPA
ncbi:MAG: hypothetical protein NW223_17410 [Hyphomicrobiaceae bacterium]|nr:hypothetical protein [Hyphomicrobiaceae bacterium]